MRHFMTLVLRGSLMSDKLLRINDVCEKLGFSRTTLHFLPQKDPAFPPKIKISARCVGYRESDIDAWLEIKARQAKGVA